MRLNPLLTTLKSFGVLMLAVLLTLSAPLPNASGASDMPVVALAGSVVDSAGKPVVGAMVRLQALRVTTYTDKEGRWRIDENSKDALFPGRLKGHGQFTFSAAGKSVRLKSSLDSNCNTYIIGKDGELADGFSFFKQGSHTIDPLSIAKPDSAPVLAGLALDAGAHATFQWRNNAWKQIFPTRDTSVTGAIDYILIRDSRFFDLQVPVSSFTKKVGKLSLKPLKGKAIYVDQRKGADANAGTKASPKKSIPAALGVAKGGDTVWLASGHYPLLKTDASFSTWVTVKPQPQAKVSIERIEVFAQGKHAAYDWGGVKDLFIRFEGMTLEDGFYANACRSVDMIDCVVHRRGKLTGNRENVYKSGVAGRRTGDLRIEGNEITKTGVGVGMNAKHIVVRNNHIHHISHDGITFTGGQHLLIEGNRIHNLDDGAPDGVGKYSTHSDSVHIFTESGDVRPWAWITDVTFRGNSMYHAECLTFMIQSRNEHQLQRMVFENNLIGPSPGYMFHLKATIQGLIFRHNSVLDMPNDSFVGTTGRTIKCHNYKFAIPANFTNTSNVQIYGNIFRDSFEHFASAKDRALTRCDNNIFYGKGIERELGKGSKIIEASPFAKPGDPSGTLKPNSPAVNGVVGADYPSLTYDRYFKKRDKSPDIGAVER